jgi:N-acetylneuraminate synthase
MKAGNNNSIVIAEIGINYAYGNSQSLFMDNVKRLIDVAKVSGANYVKFQKRTPDLCVPEKEKGKPKRVPWRKEETTYLQYKLDIELNQAQYDEIDDYCREKGIGWFASVWDKESVDFMRRYTSPLPNGKWGIMLKIPSALITDLDLVQYAKDCSDFLLISTGMSSQHEIDLAIEVGEPNVVFHTNSTYPSPVEDLNLDYIQYLNHISSEFKKEFEVGYSGHEFGLTTTVAASILGARWIERHITLDRTHWGSDQMSSVEPQGLIKLVKSIRDVELARGGYGVREVFESEKEKRKTLRGR